MNRNTAGITPANPEKPCSELIHPSSFRLHPFVFSLGLKISGARVFVRHLVGSQKLLLQFFNFREADEGVQGEDKDEG